MDLPIIPPNCNEPSLNTLILYFATNPDYLLQPEFTVLNEYHKNSLEPWSNHKYYLYGQLSTCPDTPISNELLQSAVEVNRERSKKYGGPCNSFEAASIMTQDTLFTNLLKVLCIYYEKVTL